MHKIVEAFEKYYEENKVTLTIKILVIAETFRHNYEITKKERSHVGLGCFS